MSGVAEPKNVEEKSGKKRTKEEGLPVATQHAILFLLFLNKARFTQQRRKKERRGERRRREGRANLRLPHQQKTTAKKRKDVFLSFFSFFLKTGFSAKKGFFPLKERLRQEKKEMKERKGKM